MASSTRFFVNLVGMAGTTVMLFAPPRRWPKSSSPLSLFRLQNLGSRLIAAPSMGRTLPPSKAHRPASRIGGHVRVDAGVRNTGQGAGAAPAAMRSEGIEGGDSDLGGAEHLRLRQDAAPTYDGSYLR